MIQYDVWQKAGKHDPRDIGPTFKKQRLGTYLQIVMGLEPQGAVSAYKEQYYLFFMQDDGNVGKIDTRYGYLKPIPNS